MKSLNRVVRVAVASCLVMALCAPHAAQSEDLSSADAAWTAMKKCAAIAEDAPRHACADKVMHDAGVMAPPEARTAARRKGFGLQAHPPAPAPALPLADAPHAATPTHDDDRVEVTLARVEQAGDGKLVLTTTEGAVWRQVESDAIRPTPTQGQTMTIAKGIFGSFLCKPGKWAAFRCSRAR